MVPTFHTTRKQIKFSYSFWQEKNIITRDVVNYNR